MKKYLFAFLGLLVISMFVCPPHHAYANGMRDSVVKIFVTSNSMDYYRPWQSQGSTANSGSGCIISGNRIVTNAHVVTDATFIQVRKESNPKKYTARIEAIGHDSDLAILTVDDPEFFKGIEPLEFGELPQLQDAVAVIGFPVGGDKLSITEGVVSRIEIVSYSQTAKKLLGVQIDAAINPGNSGGPVFQNGKLVGIAMQVMGGSQSIGYMIPVPIIQHFLTDIQDGNDDGFPSLGVDFHNTENKALREFYQLDDQEGGVLITRVLPYSSAEGQLQEGDVILELDAVPIAMDGTFEFRENERLALSHLINSKQSGEAMKVKYKREGKVEIKDVVLKDFVGLVPFPNHYEKPPYYIYGGMIFTVLSTDLLESWGKEWWEKAPIGFLHYLLGSGRMNPERKQEKVVLLYVLPDDVSIGYHGHSNDVIEKVNGQEFNSFQEFVSLLEKNKERFIIFETDTALEIILDTQDIQTVTENILKRNHIPDQYSADVSEWLRNPAP